VKKFATFAAAIAAFGFVNAASAADMPTKAPMMAPVYNWSGWYVGFNAGAAVDPAHVQTTTLNPPASYFTVTSATPFNAAGDQTFHTPGFTGGIQAGYNWQMNNTVLGIETDFNYMGLKGSSTISNPYPTGILGGYTLSQSVKTDWLFTLRPRLGWAANNWLFYVTGGLAVTRIKADYLFTDTNSAANESASINKTKAGWALGGGVEYGIVGGPWSVKAEYLHVDFSTVSTTSSNLTLGGGTIAVPTQTFTHSAKLSDDIVRVGVNYKLH